MQDMFFETLTVQRMAMMSRLVSVSDCDQEDKSLALAWLAEMNAELLKSLLEAENKNPLVGGSDSGSLLQ